MKNKGLISNLEVVPTATLVIVLLVGSMFTAYALNFGSVKIGQSHINSELISTRHWWLDVYVYAPRLNSSGGFIDYEPTGNATVLVYAKRYYDEWSWNWSIVAIGTADIWDESNGTYRAHLEFDVEYWSTVPRIPLTVVAIFPNVTETNGNLSVKTWWGSLSYDFYLDEQYYEIMFNRSRDGYFNYINDFQREIEIWNANQSLLSVFQPFCVVSSPYYNETACNYYENYATSLLNYLENNQTTIKYYLDEHTLKVYLDKPDVHIPKVASGISVKTTSSNNSCLQYGDVHVWRELINEGSGEIGPIIEPRGTCGPTTSGYETIYSKREFKDVVAAEFHGIEYRGGKSSADVTFEFNSTVKVTTSVAVSLTLGGPTQTFESGESSTESVSESVSSPMGSKDDRDDELHVPYIYKIDHFWLTYVCVGEPNCTELYGCIHYFIVTIKPIASGIGITENWDTPGLLTTSDYNCFHSVEERYGLSNSSQPRHALLKYKNKTVVRNRFATETGIVVNIGGGTEYIDVIAAIRLSIDLRVDKYTSHYMKVVYSVRFTDSNSTRNIHVIYVTVLRFGPGINEAIGSHWGVYLFQWCFPNQ